MQFFTDQCSAFRAFLAPVGSFVNLFLFCLQVDAPCRIERAKDPLLQDHVFSCDVSHGVVPAKGKLVLCIRFQPQTVGAHSTDYFTITSAGCLLQTVLKVVGSCKGTRVKAFPVSPCLLLSTTGQGQVLQEGLGTVTALSHILTFCWDSGCPLCTIWAFYLLETVVRLLEVNVQLFAGNGGFADEVILVWEDQ